MEIPINDIRKAVQEQEQPKRRVGCFMVDDHLRLEHREKVIELLAGLLVLRAVHRLDLLAIEYIAEGGAFDEISVGSAAPFYNVVGQWNTDEPEWALNRLYFERSA